MKTETTETWIIYLLHFYEEMCLCMATFSKIYIQESSKVFKLYTAKNYILSAIDSVIDDVFEDSLFISRQADETTYSELHSKHFISFWYVSEWNIIGGLLGFYIANNGKSTSNSADVVEHALNLFSHTKNCL